MRSFLLAAILTLAVFAVSAKEYEHLKDTSFNVVKNTPLQRLVIFYFGSDAKAVPVLDTLETTAAYLASLNLPKLKDFNWAKVDCENSESKKDCDEAGFKNEPDKAGIWIFTSTPHEGIQSYSGNRDVPSIANHIRHKFLPSDEKDVLSFESENALFDRLDKSERDPPKPIMMKFWETWCTHCKQLKLAYEQAAGFFKDEVEFMEVECSKNEETKAFCQHNDVKSYPTLILFDGEKKHTWNQADKSITSFQNFFLASLPEDRYQYVIDKEAAGLPSPPGVNDSDDKVRPASSEGESKKSKKADKKKTKKSKKRDEDEDDEDEDEKPKKKGKKSSKKSKKSKKRRSDDDDDDDDEDEKPKKKSKKSKKNKKKKKRDEDDEDDDEDDEPKKKKGKKSKKKSKKSKRRDDDDDDDDEDDEPKKKKSKKSRKGKKKKSKKYDDDDDEDDEPKKKSKKSKKDKKDKKEKKEKAEKKADEKAPVHDEL